MRNTEYRIDDLARAAGTTTRNVRAYLERGLLPPASGKDGRASIFDDSHLERLRLIDALLQRGFTIAHITDFFTSWETGKDLTEILGLQHAVTATWAKDDVMEVPRELVESIIGTDDAALLARLVELNLLRFDGDTAIFTEPRLLAGFAELHGYGMDLPKLIELHAEVTRRLDDLARLLITTVKQHIVTEHGPGWLPDTTTEITQTTAMLTTMRELAVASVDATFARALDTTLREELGDYLATAAEAELGKVDYSPNKPTGRR